MHSEPWRVIILPTTRRTFCFSISSGFLEQQLVSCTFPRNSHSYEERYLSIVEDCILDEPNAISENGFPARIARCFTSLSPDTSCPNGSSQRNTCSPISGRSSAQYKAGKCPYAWSRQQLNTGQIYTPVDWSRKCVSCRNMSICSTS